ncbi:hypothetical protein OTSANNIE_1619 [Anaplasma phagocytophilum str. Annie]|nr:hypothetical protein OTSANNIE_1619 [Anaplasma phagocytophilum str. Annie]
MAISHIFKALALKSDSIRCGRMHDSNAKEGTPINNAVATDLVALIVTKKP